MDVRSRLTGRRGVSLPFTDKCPALCEDQDQLEQLLQQAIRYGKQNQWNYLELRDCGPLTGEHPPSQYIEHTLDLTPQEDVIFANLKSSVKRAIRKAEKENVDVSMEYSLDAVHKFYRLNCLTRKEHGLPPQPFAFFRNLHHEALSKEQGTVVIASHSGRAIAASIFLHMGKKAIYKYGASDSRHYSLRGNNAIMWKAIKWHTDHGYESLSLGKTRTGNAGLVQFKNGWGCKETEIHYVRYDFRQKSFVQSKDFVSGRHNGIFRRVPIPVARILGSLLYRHVA